MTKKRLVIIISCVVAILVIGGGILGFLVWQSAQKVAQQEKISKQSKPVVQYEDKQQLVDDVNQKYGKGDYQGAIKEIEGQKSASEDTGLQLLLAGAYANSGDFKKAIEIYKKLDSAGKLPATEYANVAGTAERASDVAMAIEMYKKAKEYAISSKSESSDQIAVYDYKIAELEKKR
jgi:tetratricopeptide (TPR) repeat protein